MEISSKGNELRHTDHGLFSNQNDKVTDTVNEIPELSQKFSNFIFNKFLFLNLSQFKKPKKT